MSATSKVLAWPLTRLVSKAAKKLEKGLGLETVEDLLRHFPRRYIVPTELTELDALPLGETVTLIAEVVSARTRSMRARRGQMLEVVISDGSGELDLTFFNPYGHRDRLQPGFRGMFTGTVSLYRGRRQLAHPQYRPVNDPEAEDTARSRLGAPLPVYPACAGMDSWSIERAVEVTLGALGPLDEDLDAIPDSVRAEHGLLELGAAFEAIHRPQSRDDYRAARRRFRWEEALVLQTLLAQRRHATAELAATPRPKVAGALAAEFQQRLPFELTTGQSEVIEQIARDLARPTPMNRLLQGDVGSGKTMVALHAMIQVVDAQGQAVLLAPTEVLAAQHHASISAMLGDLAGGGMLGGHDAGTQVVLLTGSMSTAARKAALLAIASGDAGIVVGTHALLQESVSFFDLGLVVVDEQHRFGVEQRDALRGRASAVPHVLVMTATPIPRTVAMTVFGDLDVSTLKELPRGRSPISTHVVPLAEQPAWEQRIWARVREEVDKGYQAYVVCPRIGQDDATEPDPYAAAVGEEQERPLAGVLAMLEQLRSEPALAGLRIEPMHGRMATDEREAIMRDYAAGKVHVLVSTTVIEVGVDVPNASAMVILDADRFGISQLHQLRGRVGRGSAPGVCLLVSHYEAGSPSRERLDAVAATTDGFELARTDVQLRREGDILGAAQSGRRTSLNILRVLQDEDLIAQAREEAKALIAQDPALESHPGLRAAIAARQIESEAAFLERS